MIKVYIKYVKKAGMWVKTTTELVVEKGHHIIKQHQEWSLTKPK